MIVYQILYLFSRLITLYSFILVAYALMSWFPGSYDTKLGQFIVKICQPYLRLFDRFNLRVGPVDFTIIAAIFLLNIVGDALISIIQHLM